MHLALAAGLVFLVGLREGVRSGQVDLNALNSNVIFSGCLLLLGVLILRSDALRLLTINAYRAYGARRLGWSPRRTLMAFLAAVLCCAAVFVADPSLIQIKNERFSADAILTGLAAPFFLVALPEALALREAFIKVVGPRTATIYALSGLATLLWLMPAGPVVALFGTGVGLSLLALRLAGVNPLVLAGGHAAGLYALGPDSPIQVDLPFAPELVASAVLCAALVLAVTLSPPGGRSEHGLRHA